MKRAIIKVFTSGLNVLYYTGRAGGEWLTEDAAEAYEYSLQIAQRKAAELQKTYLLVGLMFEAVEKPA